MQNGAPATTPQLPKGNASLDFWPVLIVCPDRERAEMAAEVIGQRAARLGKHKDDWPIIGVDDGLDSATVSGLAWKTWGEVDARYLAIFAPSDVAFEELNRRGLR